MRNRQAIGAAVATVITVSVAAAVWAYGVIPAPTYESLLDRPDPAITGTIAFVRVGDDDDDDDDDDEAGNGKAGDALAASDDDGGGMGEDEG